MNIITYDDLFQEASGVQGLSNVTESMLFTVLYELDTSKLSEFKEKASNAIKKVLKPQNYTKIYFIQQINIMIWFL